MGEKVESFLEGHPYPSYQVWRRSVNPFLILEIFCRQIDRLTDMLDGT